MRRRCRTSRSRSRPRRCFPAVVLYVRNGGLTASDRTFITERIAAIKTATGIASGVSPAIVSKDGKAIEIVVPVKDNTDPQRVRSPTCATVIAKELAVGPDRVRHRAGRADRRPGWRVRRHRRGAAARRRARGVRDPDHRLPLAAAADPGAADVDLRALRGHLRDLAPGQGRSRRAQRAGAGHPVHPRHRRRDRLLAALRLPLSGGAARQREALGCDTRRVQGRVRAHPRVGGHRHPRTALPAAERPQLEQGTGPGRGDRYRVRSARGADDAARAAARLRSRRVLAASAEVRVARIRRSAARP